MFFCFEKNEEGGNNGEGGGGEKIELDMAILVSAQALSFGFSFS